jgi:hypothetical protein
MSIGPSNGRKKKGKSKKDAEAIAWAHIKHPKKKAKEGQRVMEGYARK